MNTELTPELLAIVPIVAAILQYAKKIKTVQENTDYLPLFSIIVAYGLLTATGIVVGWSAAIVPAIVIGLTACGGYSLLKAKT